MDVANTSPHVLTDASSPNIWPLTPKPHPKHARSSDKLLLKSRLPQNASSLKIAVGFRV